MKSPRIRTLGLAFLGMATAAMLMGAPAASAQGVVEANSLPSMSRVATPTGGSGVSNFPTATRLHGVTGGSGISNFPTVRSTGVKGGSGSTSLPTVR